MCESLTSVDWKKIALLSSIWYKRKNDVHTNTKTKNVLYLCIQKKKQKNRTFKKFVKVKEYRRIFITCFQGLFSIILIFQRNYSNNEEEEKLKGQKAVQHPSWYCCLAVFVLLLFTVLEEH